MEQEDILAGAGFACGAVFFGVELGHVPLALLWTAIVGSGLTLLLILVQLWASSQRTGGLLTNLVTFPLLMIGGSFFPFEAMPEWMASIGKWTPNGWALLELKELLFGDFEPARFAVSVTRGSMTMNFMPRSTASVSSRPGLASGSPPDIVIVGFVPMRSATSRSSKAGGGASQLP